MGWVGGRSTSAMSCGVHGRREQSAVRVWGGCSRGGGQDAERPDNWVSNCVHRMCEPLEACTRALTAGARLLPLRAVGCAAASNTHEPLYQAGLLQVHALMLLLQLTRAGPGAQGQANRHAACHGRRRTTLRCAAACRRAAPHAIICTAHSLATAPAPDSCAPAPPCTPAACALPPPCAPRPS